MKVRAEIEKYSSEADKIVLLWLFERWHMESEWRIMAYCEFHGTYPASHRVWKPKPVGTALYEHAKMTKMKAALEFYANAESWKEIPTGIGMMNSPAVDDGGARAQEALK